MKTTISTDLHNYLRRKELTQDEFAKKAGISQGTVSRILSGDYVPSIRTYKKIAIVMQKSPEKLAEGAIDRLQEEEDKEYEEFKEQVIDLFKIELKKARRRAFILSLTPLLAVGGLITSIVALWLAL